MSFYTKVVSSTITVMLYEQGDYIVAYCPSLDLSSYDKTQEGAKAAFQVALDIFLEYCEENGTLEQNLVACGWNLRQGFVEPTKANVPLELLTTENLHSYQLKISMPLV